MESDEKYDLFPLTIAFIFGAFLGCACDLLIGPILGLTICMLAHFRLLSSQIDSTCLVVFISAVLSVMPVRLAWKFTVSEAHAQVVDYRSRFNLCKKCGYSLRGVRYTSNVCPECGTIFRRWDAPSETAAQPTE